MIPRGGFLLPLTLIALGVVLLLGNLGLLPWDAREALEKLWPLFLIAWGLDLMLGRWGRRWGAVGLLVAVISGFLGLALLTWMLPGEVRVVSYPHQPGVTSARISLACGGCRLELQGGALPGTLARGELELRWGEQLHEEVHAQGGVAALRLESRSWGPFDFVAFLGPRRSWELTLPSDLPLELTVRAGVGGARLDLGSVALSSLELHSGVGEVEVVLPARGNFSVNIESGVGEVTVVVPPGLGVELVAQVGVGEITVPPDFTLVGGTYFSPQYQDRHQRATIWVSGGVGKLDVRYGPEP
jgi:hypothetical protein